MRGGSKPATRRVSKGGLLAGQGEPGGDICLLLDGVLGVWVDGSELAELGPRAVVGERALLEDGRRTATLRAVTAWVTVSAVGVSDGCSQEANSATHRASLTFSLVAASCVVEGISHHPVSCFLAFTVRHPGGRPHPCMPLAGAWCRPHGHGHH
jgi:cyclic nucleotide-binding protein